METSSWSEDIILGARIIPYVCMQSPPPVMQHDIPATSCNIPKKSSTHIPK